MMSLRRQNPQSFTFVLIFIQKVNCDQMLNTWKLLRVQEASQNSKRIGERTFGYVRCTQTRVS